MTLNPQQLIRCCEEVYEKPDWTSGPDDIDAAAFFQNQNGDLILAIRGTQHLDIHRRSTIEDWENDFRAHRVPIDADGKIKGMVHAGFLSSALNIYFAGESQMTERLAKGAFSQLYLTGHSKGGPVAQILAAFIKRDYGIIPRVVTFAGARTGDSDFINNYDIPCTRYEYHADIVPLLPMFGFYGAGQPIFDTTVSLAERIVKIGFLAETFNFQQLIHNHSLEYGYKPWCR